MANSPSRNSFYVWPQCYLIILSSRFFPVLSGNIFISDYNVCARFLRNQECHLCFGDGLTHLGMLHYFMHDWKLVFRHTGSIFTILLDCCGITLHNKGTWYLAAPLWFQACKVFPECTINTELLETSVCWFPKKGEQKRMCDVHANVSH